MNARFYIDLPLGPEGQELDLPPGPARHVQVLRAQPGDVLRCFDGRSDLEWQAEVLVMGRQTVRVKLLSARALDHELPAPLHLALVMPANDRMDFLVEKATELGAVSLQPLMSERSVLRLSSERAEKKRAHWQGVAQAAAEQCERVRVPHIGPVQTLSHWLSQLPATPPGECRWVLSPGAPAARRSATSGALLSLSGPEGGLSATEEEAALRAGFVRVGLGPRVLRADTAPLALLAWWGLNGL
ncbi:16S rRNA (uracil(1498)-N(3))-methyltransferase [Inhella gelatinilytica]|uniref:Ribosomal RNA small subunit methyltransferase E n=1 Tax=Inhella gelatinilytica TaxID=2795030 RepID=A0A931IVT7_9BURK|nr:16S rRNA (uracil(1498)-N(3))-methyltransferase [Inhella gelatinilytica]MBH9551578.1 16S rRNA (uracil(1498)-N(3))-methyltransferase [Inhella gelatinilytica]